MKAIKLLKYFFLILFCSIYLCGCSPFYIIRAGWEEAGILLRRKDINKVLEEKELDQRTKEVLTLVTEARKFAEELGLNAGGSFLTYSKVDRDVLVWVLSASPKNKLTAYTWWFPIVGSIPYKGFFEKEDAIKEGELLSKKNYDIYIRPSIAYSTLGWFDDPLLSTYLKLDDLAIVNTVIHEIFHNTIWVPNHAEFNETLANLIGGLGTIEFYKSRNDNAKVLQAKKQFEDEIRLSLFINNLSERLKEFYKDNKNVDEAFLKKRDDIIIRTKSEWRNQEKSDKDLKKTNLPINNAAIIAQLIYLKQFEKYYSAYTKTNNLVDFLKILTTHKNDLENSVQPIVTFEKIFSKYY